MNGHTDTRTAAANVDKRVINWIEQWTRTDKAQLERLQYEAAYVQGLNGAKRYAQGMDTDGRAAAARLDMSLEAAARKAQAPIDNTAAARVLTLIDISAAADRQAADNRRMIEAMNAYNEAMNNLQADTDARRAARSAYNMIRLELIFNIARRAASYAPITSGLCFQLVGVNIALASANAAARGLAREPNQTDMNASAARVNLIERVRYELKVCKRAILRGLPALPACDTIAADMAQAAAAAACEADTFEAARKAAYKAVNALLHASRAAASKTRSIYMVDMNGLASDIMLPIVYQRAGIENEHDVKALDIALDTVTARLDARDIMTLEALLAGHTQAALARRMGLSRMGVCKRVKRLRDNLGGLQGFKSLLDIK